MEVWHVPNRIYFGAGALGALVDEVKRSELSSVMLVIDELAAQIGAAERVQKLLEPAGIMAYTHALRAPRVQSEDAAELSEAARAHRTEGYVAIGSSQTIDLGKLARFGVEGNTPSDVRLIAVPLTVADGSECGRSVRYREDADSAPITVSDDSLLPNAAIIDVDLLEPRTSEDIVSDMFSALAMNVEAYLAEGDHPIADALALRGIRLAVKSIGPAVEDAEDQADHVERALQDLQMSAVIASIASQKGQGASAALAEALAHKRGIPRGVAQAIVLPAVIDFNRSARLERIAKIGKILDAKGSDEETLAFECSGAVRALRRKLDLPNGLDALGGPDDDLEAIAKAAAQDEAMHDKNPRSCSEDDMLALLSAS